jgi:hypothetical protein
MSTYFSFRWKIPEESSKLEVFVDALLKYLRACGPTEYGESSTKLYIKIENTSYKKF